MFAAMRPDATLPRGTNSGKCSIFESDTCENGLLGVAALKMCDARLNVRSHPSRVANAPTDLFRKTNVLQSQAIYSCKRSKDNLIANNRCMICCHDFCE